MRREDSGAPDFLADNDNPPAIPPPPPRLAATADRLRRLTIWMVLASTLIAISLAVGTGVRVDPAGTSALNLLIAALLLVSRIWWDREGHHRIADAFGTVAVASLGGMACGAIAMLELRLHFPVADTTLQSWDHALGVDGNAIVQALINQGPWLFELMKPAYNYTLQIFFGGLVVRALLGDRAEAWRGAFCFVGTLFTTCVIAGFAPAKGLGVWAPDTLLAQLPPRAMRHFWPHFDEFYFGAQPVLRLQVIDGVISFPSFHTIVGFMIFAMWRKNILTAVPAGLFLVFMLLAIFPGGGHYFVDMLGGIAVWASWFALSRMAERPHSDSPSKLWQFLRHGPRNVEA